MNQNHNRGLSVLLSLIFLVVFNVLFFLIGGTDRPLSVWVSYIFIHIAYFAVLLTPMLAPRGKESTVLGLPLAAVSYAYFFAEFVIGLIFILAKPASAKGAIAVQLILAACWLFVLVVNLMANNTTSAQMERHAGEVQFIKVASAQLQVLRNSVADVSLRKQIESLYDTMHASPARSTPAVQTFEQAILTQITVLQNAVTAQDQEGIQAAIRSIQMNIATRNQMLSIGQ